MTHYKKQHFVPQMLQEFFSLDGNTIGCYILNSGKTCNSPISHTAQKDWFYRTSDTDKTSIEHVHSNIEGAVKPVLQRINNKEFHLNSEEIDDLFLFVVTQLMRTQKAAQAMGAVLNFCIKTGISDVCKEVVSGFRNKSNLPMQASIAIPHVATYLSGKAFLLISNDTDIKFLLSDNPCCLFSPATTIAEDRHIENKISIQKPFSGYMLYMPLGPSVGMLCFDDDYH